MHQFYHRCPFYLNLFNLIEVYRRRNLVMFLIDTCGLAEKA